MLKIEAEPWTVADAAELYEVARWGNGYFSINDAGHVCVHPTKDPDRSIDLKATRRSACNCGASICRF